MLAPNLSSVPWGVARGEGCAVSRVAWANAPDANANAETKATATIGERIDALLRFDLANFRYGLFERSHGVRKKDQYAAVTGACYALASKGQSQRPGEDDTESQNGNCNWIVRRN